MGTPRDIVNAVEEIYLSGCISLGKCHKDTLKRWEKAVNEYLENEKCDWRVKANYKDNTLSVTYDNEGE